MDLIEILKVAGPPTAVILAIFAAFRALRADINKMSVVEAVQTEKITAMEKDLSIIQLEVTDIRTELHRHATDDAALFAEHGANIKSNLQRIERLEKTA